MRLSPLIGIAMMVTIVLWCAPVCAPVWAAEDTEASTEEQTPAVIIFSSGTWHLVSSLALKDGSVLYTKPGEYQRAVPEYKVDSRRTTEVNQALEKLVEFCLTDNDDISGIAGLKGRSAAIFVEVSKRTMPKCLAAVRERSQRNEAAASDQAKQESLSGLTDAETSATLQSADKVVLTNRSVANTARRADGYSTKKKKPAGRSVEHADLAPEVIAEDCQNEGAVGTAQYNACYDRQAAALSRLNARKPESVTEKVFLDIRAQCRNEWARDYQKRDNCERDQIGAYHAVQRLATDPRYDAVFLNRTRVECERAWGAQYTMQKVCLQEQLRAAQPKN